MLKKLQKKSMYNELDINKDGVVSDEEMHAAELQHDLVDIERVNALADISNLMYISGAGIVGAYMGSAAIMNNRKK